MNIAELLGKVLKKSNHHRNSLAGRTHSYDNSHLGSPSPPLMSSINCPSGGSDIFNRERERRLLSLEAALLDDNDDFFEFRCDGGGIHTGSPTTRRPNSTARMGDDDGVEPKQTVHVGVDAQQNGSGEHLDTGAVKPTRPPPVYRKDSAWSGTTTVSSCMTDPMDNASDGSEDRDSVVTV